jgi:hypothetical protein
VYSLPFENYNLVGGINNKQMQRHTGVQMRFDTRFSRKREAFTVSFGDFLGVNTFLVANLKLPTWHH